jgi:EAL domain-containing protein (putative c-di-GMP-specific phosphodiesterase class I)
MRERTLDKIRYEEEIHTALLSNQFVLYYQPQISLRTGNVIGAEALIRWQHPQRGMVPPDQFIGIAEQTGQIIPIGYWVIQQACHYLRDRQQRQLPQIPIHVNLSALQLSDPNLPQFLADVFEQSAIDTQYFGIEITETALLNDANLALSILTELKAMGVSLAIDDFGIGYSSLGLLKNLPFDTLKIDRSFVMDLEDDHDDRKIVEAIIAMSHKLNLHIVAEGIETPFQREMLSSFACDAGQGYLISRPIPSTEFDALANRGDLIFCDPFKSQV